MSVILMNVYDLRAGGKTILSIKIETASWLPVRPRVRVAWFRYLVSSALRRYFCESAPVVTA